MIMNQTKILRYSLKKFIFFSIIIFITNIILIASFVFYIREKQTTTETVKIISEHITITKNNVHIPKNDISSLKEQKLWLMVLDKQTGKQVYEQYKPTEVPSQFDYGDILQFSRYYLSDYPVFSQIKGDYIIVVGFPKDKIARYSYNYLDIDSIRLIPLVAFGVLLFNCLYFAFLYYYGVTHINRKIAPLVTAIQNLPDGLKNPINSISELEYLTTAINQTDTLLKENEVFKEQWISGIAHDIKTPLSVIISNASLLNDSELDTQSKKHIRPILTESYYIQNILNDLNIVARLSSGHLQLNQTETKIIPFFKDILIHILNQEIWNDFEFEFDYDYSLVNQSIMIEQFLITRVIHNIIYNSVLHNEKGCTIRIYLFKKDTNVIVEIKDNGQGASPEKIAELNELSFKNIDISKIRTTGIGLKISKQIVDLHQGSISFASVQNEFFESIISLPIFNIAN